VLIGLLGLIPMILALTTGAVSFNRDALDQIQPDALSPYADVTAPLLNVNAGALAFVLAIFVGMSAVYYAGSWVAYGGTPGQRALKVHVAELADGSNLSIGRSLLRWVALDGLGLAFGCIAIVAFLDALSTMPTSSWLDPYAVRSSSYSVGMGSNVASIASFIWLVILIASAAMHRDRRGVHDRIAGSLVVSPQPAYPIYPRYPHPPQPGFPPPGYPPQAYQGYPPQGGPAYPYPPQAYPGYPPQAPAGPAPAWPTSPQPAPSVPPPPEVQAPDSGQAPPAPPAPSL
jgi:uncharacterized RDD family membrane protein YckC